MFWTVWEANFEWCRHRSWQLPKTRQGLVQRACSTNRVVRDFQRQGPELVSARRISDNHT